MEFFSEAELLEDFEIGDYILVEGMREEYPFRLCYFCTRVESAGDGSLCAEDTGPEMHPHQLTRIVDCTKAIEV